MIKYQILARRYYSASDLAFSLTYISTTQSSRVEVDDILSRVMSASGEDPNTHLQGLFASLRSHNGSSQQTTQAPLKEPSTFGFDGNITSKGSTDQQRMNTS